MPTDKFTSKDKHPSETDLTKKMGDTYQVYEVVVTSLKSEYRGINFEWKFSKTSGWYITCDKGSKRLFYLFPADGDFLFKMVFNDSSLEKLRNGPFPGHILDMIRSAKKYPEGYLCVFDKCNFEPDTILKLLRVKIGH